jgi:paired amphipathic helix protein Sin3a
VTTLFNTAPDLLEDFKQFLPESAAQAKAAAKAAEDAAAMGLAGVSHTPQPVHTARGDQKLPPVGNFPPPSTSKDGRKRTRPPTTTAAVAMGPLGDGGAARGSIGQVANANKVSGHYLSFLTSRLFRIILSFISFQHTGKATHVC